MTTPSHDFDDHDYDDFAALDPFLRIIEGGLAGFVDGRHFFDLLAEDVIFVSVITVKDRKVTHWRDHLDPVAVFNAIGWPAW